MIDIITSYIEEKAFFEGCKRIKETLNANNNINKVFFLVPEQFTVEAEKMLTDKLTLKGLIDIEVISITRLTNRILSKTKCDIPPILNDSGKSMVINFILNKYKDELLCFRKLSSKPSFNENICELFTELKRNNVTDEDLDPNNLINDETNKDYFYKKTYDIHKIYKKYNEYLQKDFWDNDELTLYASQNLDKAKFLNNCEIYYFGYENFEMNIYELIKAFTKKGIKQTFLFSAKMEQASKSYEIVYDTIDKIKQLASNQNIYVNTTNITEEEKSKDIKFLADNLFSYSTKEFKENVENIKIFKAEDIYREVEQTALSILNLVKKEKAAYNDILVLPSDYDTYKDVIKDIFQKHEINFFLDNKTNIIDTNIIRGIIKILNIVSNNYKPHDVISFLKTGLTSLSNEDIEIFENYALEFGIKGNMWVKDFNRNNQRNDYDLTYLNEKKTEFMTPLVLLREKLKKTKLAGEITTEFYLFLKEYGIYDIIKTQVETFKRSNEFTLANKYAQIYNCIISVLEQIHNFFKEEKMSINEYARILESGFRALKIGIIPSTIDSVNIATISRTRTGDIKYIFILGVNDGILPSNFANESGIFSNNEKIKMQQHGLNIRSTNEYKEQEEKYFLTSIILKAQNRVYFSYPLTSISSKELRESSIIMRIKSLMPNVEEKTFNSLSFSDNLNLISTYSSTFEHLIDNKISPSSNEKINNLWDSVYSIFEDNQKGKELNQILNSALSFNNDAKLKNKEILKKLYNNEMTTSISRLENFKKCPFSYFISYLIKPIERAKLEIKTPEIGTILHNIIYNFSQKIIKNEIDPKVVSLNEINTLAKELTENEIKKYSKGKVAQMVNSSYFKGKLLKISQYALNEIISQLKKGDFVLSKCESEFGKGNIEKLSFVTSDNNIMTITGKIDRIDTYESGDGKYIKIIDYKTTKNSFNITQAFYGISMQLPIYLLASTQNEEKPAGALYFKISPSIKEIDNANDLNDIKDITNENLNGIILNDTSIVEKMDIMHDTKNGSIKIKRNDNALSSETINDLIEHSKKLAMEITDNIIKGDIKIYPYELSSKNACTYCKYSNICKFDTCFKGNEFNKLEPIKPKQVQEKLKEENKNELD